MGCGSGGCASGGCASGGCGALGSAASSGGGGCSSGGGCGQSAWDGNYRSVAGLQIGAHAKTWYCDSTGYELLTGESCVLDVDGGEEYARVVQGTGASRKFSGVKGMWRVLRRPSPADEERHAGALALRREATSYCREKVDELRLAMKLVDAEPSFDGRRMTFTFTSEERVDFRELVRDLSQQFRRRIEMHQVGARDEAKLLGGYGLCGRPICCATFLPEFPPISIKMAKRQGIGMNPSKISGLCGRLMCCLRYEDYPEAKSASPKPDPAPAPAPAN
ncbi:MAG: stage 0 sporulation protein [Acidobacteria bacterium]|nr:stage 0 sporulation protein [Acidobacteriota bacterium]